jgi:hypothetical protein
MHVANRRLVLRIFLWLFAVMSVAVLSITYYGVGQQIAKKPHASDFYKFYLSSQLLHRGESMYWPLPDFRSPASPCNKNNPANLERSSKKASELSDSEILACLHPNLNPPVSAAFIWHFSRFDFGTAWWLWSIASLGSAFVAISAILIARVSRVFDSGLASVFVFIGFFAYFPTFASFVLGQVTFFVFLLLGLSWLALRRGNQLLAGALLGAAASLKPFVGLFLFTLLLTKYWRACLAFLTVGAVAFVLGGVLGGFPVYLEYMDALQSVSWHAASWNASFAGFFSRIFGGSENKPWIDAPLVAAVMTAVLSTAVLARLIYCARRSATLEGRLRADILFSTTIPAMLLLSPLGWLYYFPLLFISVVVIWNLSEELPKRITYRLLLTLAFAFTVVPRMMLPSAAMNDARAWFWDAGTYFYALLIVFFLSTLLAVAATRLPRSS